MLLRSPADYFPTLTASTMILHFLALGAFVFQTECYFSEEKYPEESKMQPPTVVIAIIARNTGHSLPYYLGALERLNYPKDRISVWWVSCMDCQAVCRGVSFLSVYSSRSKGQWHLNEFVKAAASYPSPVPSAPFTVQAAFHSAAFVSYRRSLGVLCPVKFVYSNCTSSDFTSL